MFLLLTYFTHFSSISVVDFGQVNVSWEKTKSISRYCSYLFKRFPVFCRICENLPFVTPDMHAFVCLSEDKNFFYLKCCRILKSIDINRIIAVKWFNNPITSLKNHLVCFKEFLQIKLKVDNGRVVLHFD